MFWPRVTAVFVGVQALIICAYGIWVLGIGLTRSEQAWTLVAVAVVAATAAWGAAAAWRARSSWALSVQLPLTAVMAFGAASYFAESTSNIGYLVASLALLLGLLRLGVHRSVVASIPAIVLSVAAIVAVTVPPIDPGPNQQECAAPALELFSEFQYDFSEPQVISRETAFRALCQPFARERYWFAIMASVGAGLAVEVQRRRAPAAAD